MKARALPMQTDLFNTMPSQTVLPSVNRAEAVQWLARLLDEVGQAQASQPTNKEAGDEQD